MEMKRQKKRTLNRVENFYGYLFVSPWIVGFLFLTLGPMLFSLALSFSDWNAHESLNAHAFVGFDNYKELLSKDPLFWKALFNTSYYVIFSVPIGIIFALLLALLLNQKIKGIYVFRTIFYIPSLVAGVATAILWRWMFNPDFGVINSVLKMGGIKGPAWLQDPVWAKPALIIMSLWGVGGTMLVFLAGLQNIPGHLYEVAKIDGASRWRQFWHVTIPMLTPTIFFTLIMGIIGCFQIFTSVYIMSPDSAGGTKNSLLFYVLYLYRKGFVEFEMGYASALAWILFIIILTLTLFVFRSSALWVYYEGEKK